MAEIRVAVLSDDLIWGTRLVELVRAAGTTAIACRSAALFEQALPGAELAIVDLTARSYDSVAAIALAAGQGRRVLAVGQHDDHALRSRARRAGADRVLAYRAVAEGGPRVLDGWIRDAAQPRSDQTGRTPVGAGPEPARAAPRGPSPETRP